MKISLNWLSKYIDAAPIRNDLRAMAERLTMRGLEVEAVHDLSKGFAKVIVAQIEAREKHPNADRLSVCKVRTGAEVLQIVCGAQNMKAGDKVALSQIGAHLPNGLKVEESKIRGVESFGMLCSETELGLAEKSEGILILPADAPVGAPLAQFLGRDDVVLEINVTPNRGDALSHIGVARELAALTGQAIRMPELSLKEDGLEAASRVKVGIENGAGPERCLQYHARVIEGVSVGPSPRWLSAALEAVGQRSINNAVDVTNFILMELGQPLHAFDFDKIKGGAIVARGARAGENLPLLDGTAATLSDEDCVIADAERPVALAGVMGGGNSEVTERTETIVLEGAQFLPSSVRKTARRHQKQTDSSYRFERQVDGRGVAFALDRAAQLLQEVAGGRILKGRVSAFSPSGRMLANGEPHQVQVSMGAMNAFLGTHLTRGQTAGMLEQLGFSCAEASGDRLEVRVPSYRPDVRMPEDVCEEVVRIWGYDAVQPVVPVLSDMPAPIAQAEKRFSSIDQIKRCLARAGFNEAVHFAFNSKELNMKWGEGEGIRLRNPLNEEFTHLKTSLLAGLVPSFVRAVHHQSSDVRLFEVRPAYAVDDASPTGAAELWRIGIIASGRSYSSEYAARDREFDFFAMKGVVEELLDELGVRGARYLPLEEDARFHPSQSARVVLGKGPCGFIARLHPRFQRDWKWRRPVLVAEIALDRVLELAKADRKYAPISKFPKATRELSVVADRKIAAEKLISAVQKHGKPLVESAQVIDLFLSDKLGPGKMSVSIGIVLSDPSRTLEDAELDGVQKKIIEGLARDLGVELRG